MIEQDIVHGQRAKRLLEDEALAKAFADVESAITTKWKAAPVRDREAHHELKLMLKLLGDVRANLERAVADGKLAADELQRLQQRESPATKLRNWWRT